MSDEARRVEMQALADEFNLKLGMLEWALGMVRSMKVEPDDRIAERLSDGAQTTGFEPAVAERFVARARKLI